MDRRLLAALALVALLVGILVAVAVMRDDPGSGDGPCTAPNTVAPDGKCATAAETCYAWFDQPVTRTVSCTAESRDGSGFVKLDLNGQGSAQVVVRDHVGRTIYQRAVTFNAVNQDLDSFSAPRGVWTLQVTWDTDGGLGRVYLYG